MVIGMDINILFPVLNERLRLKRGIETTVSYLRENGTIPWRLTILDNGSDDETPQIAAALCEKYPEVHYVRLEERGVGIAFRRGVKENESEIVGYMDIDLSTDIRHLGQVIAIFAERPEVEYVNGDRFDTQSRTVGRKWYRKVTSKGLVFLLKTLLNMKSGDAVCGFTFLRREAADRLVAVTGKENGWFYTIELLLRAERMGMNIVDLPVEWTEDYNTTVHIGRTVRNYLTQMLRLRREFRREDGR